MIKIINKNDNDLQRIMNRSQLNLEDVNSVVKDIIKNVRNFGDLKVIEYTNQFDNVLISNLKVSEQEIEEAFQRIDETLLSDLTKAKDNIYRYHINQKLKSFTINPSTGVILTQVAKAIENVGIYIPGGTAAYPSTVLMNAVPASIA
ncbi:MAG: histidinol dehydrogenase, partial [Acholeplasmataceae bacterium]|nr:histidinol dehydrogenase [Acholeplasmataceae bacterium]